MNSSIGNNAVNRVPKTSLSGAIEEALKEHGDFSIDDFELITDGEGNFECHVVFHRNEAPADE